MIAEKPFSSPVRVNDMIGDATADDTSPPVIKVASNGDDMYHGHIMILTNSSQNSFMVILHYV